MNPWLGIGLLLGVLGLALAVAAGLARLGWLGPEAARKAVHVVLGLTVAAFPWCFTAWWPVALLGGLSLASLMALRWVPWLRRTAGPALHGVERQSWGDLCFPVAVVLLWTLAPSDPLRYSLPLLILGTADAVAALVGRRYGQTGYSTAGGRKSWEGSLAFAAATFLVVHVPLLLATETGRAECLLIAVNLAILLMLVEGLAWEGFDNLFIPVAACLLIDDWLHLPLRDLLHCTGAMVALAVGCWWWRGRTTLDDAAILGCAVLGYVLWAAGGWQWLVAPVLLFVTYTRLAPARDRARDHRALIPFAILLPVLAWLLVERRANPGPWLIAAASSCVVHLGSIVLLTRAHAHPQDHLGHLLVRAWPVPTLVLLGPLALLLGPTWAFAGAAVGGLLGILAVWLVVPDRRELPMDDRRWWRQSLAAGLGSLMTLAVR